MLRMLCYTVILLEHYQNVTRISLPGLLEYYSNVTGILLECYWNTVISLGCQGARVCWKIARTLHRVVVNVV